MPTRCGSISALPRHFGCGPISSSSTNDVSAARVPATFSQIPGWSSTSQAAQPVTWPSGKVVARFS